MERITGSEAIVKALIREGVDTIFGYPGGAIMPMYDALYDYRDQVRHILVRHEQGATHAAEGYARILGKPGVCVATSGPGATNLVTGIADAMLDSVPMVCITGQVVSSALGMDAFQETDVLGVTMPITKWNYQVSKAEDIAEVLSKAFYIARTGRPGPVVIDITKDAQLGECDFEYESITSINSYRVKTLPDPENIQAAAELINNAERPLMFVGHGVLISNAEQEARLLAEKTGMPVAQTLHGMSAFSVDHPLYTGMLGMHGHYGPNLLSNEADVVLAVGMRFDDRVTGDLARYLTKTKVIHIDIDPAEIDKCVQADIAIRADAKCALGKLLNSVKENSHDQWVGKFKECFQTETEKVIKKGLNPGQGKLRMPEIVRLISEQTKGEAIVVSDVGQHQMMSARYYNFERPNSYITSGGLGTMGFGLPAAMGCKVAAPDRTVIAFMGDGSFQMTLQELATIAQEDIPVKGVIMNNGFLGMVRQWQELFFDKRYSFTTLHNPDFVKICEGFGVQAEKIVVRADLEAAVDRMLSSDSAYIIEAVVENEENVFPMVPAGASVSDVRLE